MWKGTACWFCMILSAWGGLSLTNEAARAEKLDIKNMTCRQLASWKSDDRYDVFVFVLGFYGGMTKSLELDDDIIEPFAKKFEAWCATHPDAKLLESVKTVFDAR